MPKQATGEVRIRGGVFEARITIKGRDRRSFTLPHCQNQAAAEARATVLANLARRLRKAGLVETNQGAQLLESAAYAHTDHDLESSLADADIIISGSMSKQTGRPRTGSLYLAKSGWRARVTVLVGAKNVQRSFDLGTQSKDVAEVKLKDIIDRDPIRLAKPDDDTRRLLDMANESRSEPLDLALALTIKTASDCGQWEIVKLLAECIRDTRIAREYETNNYEPIEYEF